MDAHNHYAEHLFTLNSFLTTFSTAQGRHRYAQRHNPGRKQMETFGHDAHLTQRPAEGGFSGAECKLAVQSEQSSKLSTLAIL